VSLQQQKIRERKDIGCAGREWREQTSVQACGWLYAVMAAFLPRASGMRLLVSFLNLALVRFERKVGYTQAELRPEALKNTEAIIAHSGKLSCRPSPLAELYCYYCSCNFKPV